MFSASPIKLLALLGFGAAVLAQSLPASAGQFNVKPIRVFLNKETGSTILTVENEASQPLRLQVRGYAWRNDKHGQPLLTPTDDLVVFPTLVTIAPMERRSIRVGFSGNAAAQELTYRIALDELPSLESQLAAHKQPGLEVRTRITVPVFFTPLISTGKAEIDTVSVNRTGIDADFRNLGNVHATVSEAQIVGRDASGAKLFERRVNGWYVLPGEDWLVHADVPHACSRLKTVQVIIESDIGRFQRSVDASAEGCKA